MHVKDWKINLWLRLLLLLQRTRVQCPAPTSGRLQTLWCQFQGDFWLPGATPSSAHALHGHTGMQMTTITNKSLKRVKSRCALIGRVKGG